MLNPQKFHQNTSKVKLMSDFEAHFVETFHEAIKHKPIIFVLYVLKNE